MNKVLEHEYLQPVAENFEAFKQAWIEEFSRHNTNEGERTQATGWMAQTNAAASTSATEEESKRATDSQSQERD